MILLMFKQITFSTFKQMFKQMFKQCSNKLLSLSLLVSGLIDHVETKHCVNKQGTAKQYKITNKPNIFS